MLDYKTRVSSIYIHIILFCLLSLCGAHVCVCMRVLERERESVSSAGVWQVNVLLPLVLSWSSWHWSAAWVDLQLPWINPVTPPDRSSMQSPQIQVAPRWFSSTSLLSSYLFYHNFFALLLVLCLKVVPSIVYAVFFLFIQSFHCSRFRLSTGIKGKPAWGGTVSALHLTASTRDWRVPVALLQQREQSG